MAESSLLSPIVMEASKKGIGLTGVRLEHRNPTTGQFVKGHCGRVPGSKNRRTAEKAAQLKVHPFDYLASLLEDPQTEKALRVASASTLLPYCCAKLKEQPARRVVNPIVISPPQSASEAADAISLIAAKAASGGMDLNDAADLTKLLESYARTFAAADFEALAAKVRRRCGPSC
jgi:hypothetical protein